MLNNIKKWGKQFLGYGVSQFLVISIPIILTPILTRSLIIEEFADYSLYKSLLGLLLPLVSMAFSTYLLKNYFSGLDRELEIFLSSIISVSLIIGAILLLFSIIFKNIILHFLDINNFEIIIYVFINVFLLSIYNLILTVFRARSNIIHFLISNAILFSISIGTILILYWIGRITLELVLITNSIAYIATIFFGIFKLLKFNVRKFSVNFKLIKKGIRFSMPLVIYSLLSQIFAQSDKLIINSLLEKSELAIYYAVFQLSFGISAFGNVLQLAWGPFVFREMAFEKAHIPKRIFRGIFFLFVITICFSVIYYLFFPTLQSIFLPLNYFSGRNFYIWLLLGGTFQVFYWILNPLLTVYEKNIYFVYITLVTAIITVSMNLIFIKNGIKYAAMIYLLSYIIQFFGLLIAIYYAKKYFQTLQPNTKIS